jgi:hypothetical protein
VPLPPPPPPPASVLASETLAKRSARLAAAPKGDLLGEAGRERPAGARGGVRLILGEALTGGRREGRKEVVGDGRASGVELVRCEV